MKIIFLSVAVLALLPAIGICKDEEAKVPAHEQLLHLFGENIWLSQFRLDEDEDEETIRLSFTIFDSSPRESIFRVYLNAYKKTAGATGAEWQLQWNEKFERLTTRVTFEIAKGHESNFYLTFGGSTVSDVGSSSFYSKGVGVDRIMKLIKDRDAEAKLKDASGAEGTDKAEQDDAVQPAPDVDSKTEGKEKTKPESEGRSQ